MFSDFNPSDKQHVKWLKKLIDADVENKLKVLAENPMKKEIPPFDVIQVMFGLSMRYTQAVFNNTAYILNDS